MARVANVIDARARVVVITGAESTGKSTLAAALAKEFGATLSLEFARAYAERVQRALDASDVESIAQGQLANEDAAIARAAGGMAVLDTDLRSTLLYAQHYYGQRQVPAWLRAAVEARRVALYLLCDDDVPWRPDPVRDSAEARSAMQRRIAASVRASEAPVVLVRGTPDERLKQSRAALAEWGMD